MLARRIFPLLLLSVSAFGTAQNEHSKAFWDNQYKNIAKIFNKKDTNAYGALLAPNFKCTLESKQVMTRPEYLAQNRVMFEGISVTFGQFIVMSVKPAGDTMVVNINHKYRVNFKTPPKANKKRSNGEEHATDTWKKIGSKWLIVKQVITYSNYVNFEVPYEIKHRGDGG